jgi:glycosyltransferase involved in cell wall biosynthesis
VTPIEFAKRQLHRHVGYLRLREIRNKTVLGPATIGARRFENSEVARLSAIVGDRPTGQVATVIVTYRRPELLDRAISSALAQTVTDQTIIVVDDGGGLESTIEDPRLFKVSLSRNGGILGLCRNVGIRLTSSEFVAFLDDDNEWEPNHLEVALAALDDDVDMAYTALHRVFPDGQVMDVYSEPFDRAAMARGASPADSNSIVARRAAALRFSRMRRGREVLPPEDWELVFRLSRRGRVTHVPVPTVRYLVNPDSYLTQWPEDLRQRVVSEASLAEGSI